MRVDYHIYIRYIMMYLYEKGWKAAQSFCDLFGEGAISESRCREWFESGDTSLEDKTGRGRPSDFDDQVLLAAVERDESLEGTTRLLTDTATMSVNSGGFQTKTASSNSILTAISIWLKSTAFTLQSRRKDRTKRTVSSSTTIVRVHMLSVVLSNASPITASTSAIFSHKNDCRLPRQSVAKKLAGNKVYDDFDNLVADVKTWSAFKNR
ncbi:hypothetical protein HNY73_011395 [Argiope bruennichi]|uniref:Mos1 transposase HTH domain-containing protein n=1 Tax=Argiope bruennichi TaxID=94029 RepID=A0A8T0FAC1_ARGBR|nr:hypothetical protein HNY73_011395 [Argiope bruennichi]